MLSYVHAFHAGNFADVHKHVVVSLTLEYLCRKPGALALFDFYAGAGRYDLNGAQARKTGESEAGIGKLWPAQGWPDVLRPYAEIIERQNADAASLRFYPGSPLILSELSRVQDRMVLVELHPSANDALRNLFHHDRRVQLHKRDAHESMVALLPPRESRGLVLIDPSYEGKDEYSHVTRTVRRAFKLWQHGTWCLWYPLLNGNPQRAMVDALTREAGREVLVSELRIPVSDDRMHGSGMLVINPPWALKEQLESLQIWFAALGDGQGVLKNRLVEPVASK